MVTAETTYAVPSGASSGRRSIMPLLLLLATAIILLAAAARQAVPAPVDVDVVYTSHAEKHPEAPRIRRCLENEGAHQVWRSRSWRDPFKFFRICRLDTGKIGLQIVKWSWRSLAWREVTAFIIKDGRADQVFEYLTAIAKRIV